MVRKSIVGGIIWLRDMIDMDMRLYPKDGSILEGWRWRILSWI